MPEFALALTLAGLLAAAVINIAFAMGVYVDAKRRFRLRTLLFVSPPIWTLATLFGGVVIVGAYWLMHMSTLAKETPRPIQERPEPQPVPNFPEFPAD